MSAVREILQYNIIAQGIIAIKEVVDIHSWLCANISFGQLSSSLRCCGGSWNLTEVFWRLRDRLSPV